MTGEEPQQHPTPGPPPGWAPPPYGQQPPPGAYPWPGYQPQYPPQYPPPGFAPPGFAPPRRRRSRWLTVGLPIGLVLLLGGCGVAITLFVTSIGTTIKPAEQAAKSYAQALVDQRWSDAQGMLCSQDRLVTPDQLAAHYSNPRLTAYKVQNVVVNNFNGKVSATTVLRFSTADGLSNSITLPLTKEGDTWHPCP